MIYSGKDFRFLRRFIRAFAEMGIRDFELWKSAFLRRKGVSWAKQDVKYRDGSGGYTLKPRVILQVGPAQ